MNIRRSTADIECVRYIKTREQRTIWHLVPSLQGKSLKELTPDEVVLVNLAAARWVASAEEEDQRTRKALAGFLSKKGLDDYIAKSRPFTPQVRELLDDIQKL